MGERVRVYVAHKTRISASRPPWSVKFPNGRGAGRQWVLLKDVYFIVELEGWLASCQGRQSQHAYAEGELLDVPEQDARLSGNEHGIRVDYLPGSPEPHFMRKDTQAYVSYARYAYFSPMREVLAWGSHYSAWGPLEELTPNA